MTSESRRNYSPAPFPVLTSTSTTTSQSVLPVKMFPLQLTIFSHAALVQLLLKMLNWQITQYQHLFKNGQYQLFMPDVILCHVHKPEVEKLPHSSCPCSGRVLPVVTNIRQPWFSQIFHNPGKMTSNRSRKAYPLALVLSPTRELTLQIYQEARKVHPTRLY